MSCLSDIIGNLSDSIPKKGSIYWFLSLTDFLSLKRVSKGQDPIKVSELLEHTIKAHEYIKKNNILTNYPKDSFTLISGIEINCLILGCLVHVIGLGIDIKSKYLNPYILGESPIGNDLNIKSVIKAINLAGGLSFLAHPARYRIPFYKLIPEAKIQGIDGIEVWYDYELNEVWNPSLFVCSEIDKLADKYSMLKTCGTDSHGLSLLGR